MRLTSLRRYDGYKMRHAYMIKALLIISQRLMVSGFSAFQITLWNQARLENNYKEENRIRECTLQS